MKMRIHHPFHFITVFLIALSLSSNANALVGKDPYQYFFNETWGDFQEELSNAQEQGKLGILVFFELKDCPFCHRMKKTVLNQPEVQKYFRQYFLNFSVDIKGDLEITDFTGQMLTQKDFAFKKNRVRATPVFAIYDLEGNQIARYTGATSGVEEFLLLGEYVVSGAYKETRFSKYKRLNRKK